MNSVISAFKTKKNSGSQSHNTTAATNNGLNNDKHNNLSTLNTSSSSKKKTISAQDNSYQYLRHIREIDTATKLFSPIVGTDELLEKEILNFRPTISTAGVDMVDHVTRQTVCLTPTPINTDYNMNGGGDSQIPPLENGNCNTEESLSEQSDYLTMKGQHSLSCSPISHLNDAEDDESEEHSITACTSSSSSEQSNSTVVHSPIAPTAAAAAAKAATKINTGNNAQHLATGSLVNLPSPAKSLNLSLNSNTSSSLSPSISVSSNSNSNTSLALCSSGPSSCSSTTGADVSSNDYSQPPSPTMVTRRCSESSTASTEYVPAFLKSSHVTLPIIMPNSNSSLASLPSNSNQSMAVTPINSAATTPKHSRYTKPRLSLSRFINHSMPSVHGRPNLSLAAGSGNGSSTGQRGNSSVSGSGNPPKRPSTHQRNLSLDFR